MKKSIRRSLADNVKSLMAGRQGMTVTSLAKEVGISRGQMNNILTQKSATTIDTLEKLATVLEVQPFVLLRAGAAAVPRGNSLTINLPDLPDDKDAVYSGAATLIIDALSGADDEGKFALIRHAASEMGLPDVVAYSGPRDWRDLTLELMHQYGWKQNN
jgi:DNA-binding Xre family transcriptional regulator